SEVRAKVVASQPGLDVEFIQVLQDMIGDLTGAPEPVVVKLFSPDPDLLGTWAPQVADALGKVKIGGKTPIVDVEDGIEKTTSCRDKRKSAARIFSVSSRSPPASKASTWEPASQPSRRPSPT